MDPLPEKGGNMEYPARKGELFIMVSPAAPAYTTADIRALPEGKRAELIDGKMYMMSSPTLIHQEISMWLTARIFDYIRENNGRCRVLPAPFGVFIKGDDRNYFEPDISVVCDRKKLSREGCHGAPDWIIEIVSPSSRKMDYIQKTAAYMEAGVGEYWIVDPDSGTVSVYCFRESAEPVPYSFTDRIPSATYENLSIDFAALSEYLR